MTDDVLTEVLQTFRLRGSLLYRGRLRGTWGVRIDVRPARADASFHVVTAGRCLLEVDGAGTAIVLETGDFVVLPHGHPHVLRDSLASPVHPLETLLARGANEDEAGALCYGDETGAETQILCGKFFWDGDAATNPLVGALPPLLLIRGEAGRAPRWLEATLQFLDCEKAAGQPGAQTVIGRLSDILFIQAVRAHLSDLAASGVENSWLCALADPQIGQALRAVHRRPQEPWTVAALARQAAMSRSAFAQRFRQRVGESPLQYVARWRIHAAAGLLGTSSGNDPATLGEIAARVGYASEAAFSRAFKRRTGSAPGAWRRRAL